jgi:regulator of protease activity HflC (stomatin/prohibitin superfamily)
MESAFAWLGSVMEWIGAFIPRVEILPTTDGAVKFVRGHKIVPLGPGLHVYWPLTTKFTRLAVVQQTLDLRPQKLITKDDRTVVVSGIISYEIGDIKKALADTWNVDATIKDAVLRATTRTVLALTFEELKEKARKGTLDTILRNEARKALEQYGVNVIEMSLADFAPTRVYSLVQATNEI